MLLLLGQIRIRETRKAVMSEPTLNLKNNNADDGTEWDFWENLRQICLLPEQDAFNQSGKMLYMHNVASCVHSQYLVKKKCKSTLMMHM